MKFIYPAIISKEPDARYRAVFPDLESCQACGATVDEVLEEANAAMRRWIEVELEEESALLPPASDPADLSLKENEFVRSICITYRFLGGWEE